MSLTTIVSDLRKEVATLRKANAEQEVTISQARSTIMVLQSRLAARRTKAMKAKALKGSARG